MLLYNTELHGFFPTLNRNSKGKFPRLDANMLVPKSLDFYQNGIYRLISITLFLVYASRIWQRPFKTIISKPRF